MLNKKYDIEYENGNWKDLEKSYYVIHRLCINPKNQNKGIGKKTLRYIEGEVSTLGCEAIRLDVFEKNPYALKLYYAFGYEKVGYADWRKGRFYLMEKYL